MKAHIHRYGPHPEGGIRCTFEGCRAFENDGQDTGLIQIWSDGHWLDYMRTTGPNAVAYAAAHEGFRAVDWIRKSEVLT